MKKTKGHTKENKQHPLYVRWDGMIGRCTRKNQPVYKWYGARGIRVCDRWLDFNNFIEDVGMPPDLSYHLDRIDGGGHYEPGNVRWVTVSDNLRNMKPKGKSKYRGVDFTKDGWRSRICVEKKSIHICFSKTEKEAAIKYNEAALEWFGNRANLNKIED